MVLSRVNLQYFGSHFQGVKFFSEFIGTVAAATADKAIKIAIREFAITDPERQRRLVAQRIE